VTFEATLQMSLQETFLLTLEEPGNALTCTRKDAQSYILCVPLRVSLGVQFGAQLGASLGTSLGVQFGVSLGVSLLCGLDSLKQFRRERPIHSKLETNITYVTT